MSESYKQVYLWQMTEKPEDGSDFIVTGDKDKLQPKEAEEEKKEEVLKHTLTTSASFDHVIDIQAKDTNGDNKDQAIDVQDDDIMEASLEHLQKPENLNHSLFTNVVLQVVPHANGAGDNKRKGGEDGSEPSAKKTRSVRRSCTLGLSPCFDVNPNIVI